MPIGIDRIENGNAIRETRPPPSARVEESYRENEEISEENLPPPEEGLGETIDVYA